MILACRNHPQYATRRKQKQGTAYLAYAEMSSHVRSRVAGFSRHEALVMPVKKVLGRPNRRQPEHPDNAGGLLQEQDAANRCTYRPSI